MAAKKAPAKKAAPKKTAAKKTAVKKAPAKPKVVKKESVIGRSTGEKRGTVARYTNLSRQLTSRVSEASPMSLEQVASHAMKGKLGTGRERDDALRQAGHDPSAVQKEIARQQAAAKPEKSTLPIPNNRRGSSWT